MDQEGPDSPCQGEELYFDGSHSWSIGYKKLVLLIFHPAICLILRIVTMDVKSESTDEIALFLKLLNEVCSKVTGKEHYRFNPKAIIIV